MDKSEKRDPALCQVRENDTDCFQRNQNSLKSEDATQNAAFEPGVHHETQIPMKDSAQETLKVEEIVASLQEYRELAEDDALEQKTGANRIEQQSNESLIALERDSSQTNKEEANAIYQECDVYVDKLLKSDGNATVQQPNETAINMFIAEQKSIQENYGAYRKRDKSANEPLPMLIEPFCKEELDSESCKDPMEWSLELLRQMHETSGKDRLLPENNSSSDLEERHTCLRILGDSRPSPERTCQHRTCKHRHRNLQHSVLSPVEGQEPPLEPFEVEIATRSLRNRRLSLLMSTGVRDYIRGVRERHLPPERRAFLEKFWLAFRFIVLLSFIGWFFVYSLQTDYGYNDASKLDNSNSKSSLSPYDLNINNPFANVSTDEYFSVGLSLLMKYLKRKFDGSSGSDDSDNFNFSMSTNPRFLQPIWLLTLQILSTTWALLKSFLCFSA